MGARPRRAGRCELGFQSLGFIGIPDSGEVRRAVLINQEDESNLVLADPGVVAKQETLDVRVMEMTLRRVKIAQAPLKLAILRALVGLPTKNRKCLP